MIHDYRNTRVSAFYNLCDNWHFAEKRNVKSIGQGFSAAPLPRPVINRSLALVILLLFLLLFEKVTYVW